MPSEAVSLALAASIYPPALAAIIALGRGSEVRLRVILFVLAAYCTTFVTGALMLLLFGEAGASSNALIKPSAALFAIAGVVLLVLAVRLHRTPRRDRPAESTSRIDRYLASRRLVLALGVVLYVVPSPIFAGAVKAIDDAHASTPQQLAWLAQMLLLMLWLIELPMLVLVVFPEKGLAALVAVNGWFARHGRGLLVGLCGVAGVYLLGVGLVEGLS